MIGRAVALLLGALLQNSPTTRRVATVAAAARPQQARPLLAEALRCHLARHGERHSYSARSLLRMGPVCTELGKQEDAHYYLTQALAGYTQVLGAEHPYTLCTQRVVDPPA